MTSGYSQGQGIVCRVLADRGARRIAFEDPSHPEQRRIATEAGLEIVPVAVDERGLRIEELERADVDALVLTPAHQHPTGAVLAGERRPALLAWIRAHDVVVIEDDYDAEYRYDRAAVGALQGLDARPDRLRRLGEQDAGAGVAAWLARGAVAPPGRSGRQEGPGRLRNGADRAAGVRGLPRARRARPPPAPDARAVPPAARPARRGAGGRASRRRAIRGIAAGLHATVELPGDYHEQAILEEARARRIGLTTMGEFWIEPGGGPPTLLVGYGQLPEPVIGAAVRELAEAVHAAAPATS